jgi:hypothetical protein
MFIDSCGKGWGKVVDMVWMIVESYTALVENCKSEVRSYSLPHNSYQVINEALHRKRGDIHADKTQNQLKQFMCLCKYPRYY